MMGQRISWKLFQPSQEHCTVNASQWLRGEWKKRQNSHQSGQAVTYRVRSHPSTGCCRTGWYACSHDLQVLNSAGVMPLLVIQRPWNRKSQFTTSVYLKQSNWFSVGPSIKWFVMINTITLIDLLSVFAVLHTDVIDLVKVTARFILGWPCELEVANERERVCADRDEFPLNNDY